MKLTRSAPAAFVRAFEQRLDTLMDNAAESAQPEATEYYVFGENSDLVLSVVRRGHIDRTFRITISGDPPPGDFQDFTMQLHWGHGVEKKREDVIHYLGTHFFNVNEDSPETAGRRAAGLCFDWCVMISSPTTLKTRETFDDREAEEALNTV